MKKTVYVLENKSDKVGTYRINGVDKKLYTNEKIELYVMPSSKSDNIMCNIYKRETEETILFKKKRKTF